MALLLHNQLPSVGSFASPPILFMTTMTTAASALAAVADVTPRMMQTNLEKTSLKKSLQQGQSRTRSKTGRRRRRRKRSSSIYQNYPRQSSGNLLKTINFDYSGLDSRDGLNGATNNFSEDDDLSDNPMAAYYNQLPPMMRKYSQQHKNKKPVYVSINQQTVNGLLSLLLLFMISICGSIGSIFLISALTVIESLQTRGNSYLVSLALAQLLVTIFVIPSSALQIMAADGINSRQLCHYQWLTLEFSLIVSQLSFFLIAIDNFLGYRSSEKLRLTLKRNSTSTTTNNNNSINAPPNNNSYRVGSVTETRDFTNVSNVHEPDLESGSNQLMSKQNRPASRKSGHLNAIFESSSSSDRLVLTKQLVANQLSACQEIDLLRSPGKGLIGYMNCCGRFRVLIWISLIWMLAIGYTIHQHRLSYGPQFCLALNKYKPTNSSGGRSSMGPIAQPHERPFVRNYRTSADGKSFRVHWDEFEQRELASRTRRRSLPDGRLLKEPILPPRTDRLNSIAFVGPLVRGAQDDDGGGGGGNGSLERSTTKAPTNLDTIPDGYNYDSTARRDFFPRERLASNEPTSAAQVETKLVDSSTLLEPLAETTTFDSTHALNEAPPRANELDSGPMRPDEKVAGERVSIYASVRTVSAAKQQSPAQNNNEKRTRAAAAAKESSLIWRPVQREIIWRTHCDSYHRNRTNDNKEAVQQRASLAVSVKQAVAPNRSTCFVSLPTVRKYVGHQEDDRRRRRLTFANEDENCKTMGCSRSIRAGEAALRGQQRTGQVLLSGEKVAVPIGLAANRSGRLVGKRSPTPEELANFNPHDSSSLLRISMPLKNQEASSRMLLLDKSEEYQQPKPDDSTSKTNNMTIPGERPKYFWPLMLGTIVGPSLISIILFALAYLRMREFRQRSQRPLSLASMKFYPLATSLLPHNSAFVSPIVTPSLVVPPTVIAARQQQLSNDSDELYGQAIRPKQTSSLLMIRPATHSDSATAADCSPEPDNHSSGADFKQQQQHHHRRSHSQPVDASRRPIQQLAKSRVPGFTRAEYILDQSAASSPTNWPIQEQQQQQPERRPEEIVQPSSHLHQRVNHVFSVPVSNDDHSRYYRRQHQRSTVGQTLVESPPPASDSAPTSMALVQNFSQYPHHEYDDQQLQRQQFAQKAVNLSFSAPPSATFVRPSYPIGEDLFGPSQPMDTNQLSGSTKRSRLSRSKQQAESDRHQYEFKRCQHHAQSFHNGTRQQLNNAAPGSASAQANLGHNFARLHLAQQQQQHNQLHQCISQLPSRQVPQGAPQKQQQQQLERHCSLPSSSRLYQSETGHLHLHLHPANDNNNNNSSGSGTNRASATPTNQPEGRAQAAQMEATNWPPAPVATSNVAEMSYEQLHRNQQPAICGQSSHDKKQQELTVVSEALANVIRPSQSHQHQHHHHHNRHQSLSSQSSLTSCGAGVADSPPDLDLMLAQQQQSNKQETIINLGASSPTTLAIAAAAGQQEEKGKEEEVRQKKLIVCAYPNMIDDQLLRSNIVVFVLNLSLWLPFIIMSIVWQYRSSLSEELKDTVWWMATLNCCSCSYVYALTHKDFREAFNKLFYYCCCKSHVTFQRKTPIFRRQLDLDHNGNLRIHIIPGLNVYSNKVQAALAATNETTNNHYHQLGAPSEGINHHQPPPPPLSNFIHQRTHQHRQSTAGFKLPAIVRPVVTGQATDRTVQGGVSFSAALEVGSSAVPEAVAGKSAPEGRNRAI